MVGSRALTVAAATVAAITAPAALAAHPPKLRPCPALVARGPAIGNAPSPPDLRYRVTAVRAAHGISCFAGRGLVRAWYRAGPDPSGRRALRGRYCATYDYGHRVRCWRTATTHGHRGPQILKWVVGNPR